MTTPPLAPRHPSTPVPPHPRTPAPPLLITSAPQLPTPPDPHPPDSSSPRLPRSPAPKIAFYITGHGWGHAARSSVVLKELLKTRPDMKFYIRTSLPENQLNQIMKDIPFSTHASLIDIGMTQKNALTLDLPETAKALEKFILNWDKKTNEETIWLKNKKIDFVYSDAGPLAFHAAAKANLPSLGCGNFTWDWIYKFYPGFEKFSDFFQKAYKACPLFLRQTPSCPIESPQSTETIPLIARQPLLSKEEAKKIIRSHFPDGQPVVLFTFGGIGTLKNLEKKIRKLSESYHFLDAGPSPQSSFLTHIREIPLSFQDLLAGVDCVIAKPGYGTIGEAAMARCPLILIERNDFPETPYLIEAAKKWNDARVIPFSFFDSEGFEVLLQETIKNRPSGSPPENKGAQKVSKKILKLIL